MNFKSEKGVALPLVLTLMILFFALLAGLLPMMAHEVRFSTYNTKYVSSRYAAEAAAKYAIHRIQVIVNGGTVPTQAQCTTIANAINNNGNKISNSSPVTLSCTFNPDNASKPTVYYIRVTGSYGNTTAVAKVNFYLQNSPVWDAANIVDLINTGTYSHVGHNPKGTDPARWTITKDDDPETPDTADSSNQVEVSQVMFNDSWGDTMNVKYKANATSGVTSGGGYGIYYGAIGNADNMNAYVLQWDPGAQNDSSLKYSTSGYSATHGTLLVKKVIFDPNNYTNSTSSNFTNVTSSSGPGSYERNEWGYPSGSDGKYYALPFQSANSGETLRIPLQSSDDSAANGTSLETAMNDYYKSIGSAETFNISDTHVIQIKVTDVNGKLMHNIYVDGKTTPVLSFYDHSTNKYKKSDSKATSSTTSATYIRNTTRTLSGTHTGVRLWNKSVNVSFANAEGSNQIVRKTVVWVN